MASRRHRRPPDHRRARLSPRTPCQPPPLDHQLAHRPRSCTGLGQQKAVGAPGKGYEASSPCNSKLQDPMRARPRPRNHHRAQLGVTASQQPASCATKLEDNHRCKVRRLPPAVEGRSRPRKGGSSPASPPTQEQPRRDGGGCHAAAGERHHHQLRWMDLDLGAQGAELDDSPCARPS